MKAIELLEAKKQHKPSQYRVEFQNMGPTDRMQQAAMYAKQYCSQYIARFSKKPGVIRGSNSDFDAAVINPGVVGRESANTTNQYTVLLSNLPNWAAFPKRSMSIICSTSEGTAASYGGLYAVVLPDTFRLGICSAGDIWNSFDYLTQQTDGGLYGMDVFNEQLAMILDYVGAKSTTYQQIQAGCARLDKLILKSKKPKKSYDEDEDSEDPEDSFVYNITDGQDDLLRCLYRSKKPSFETIALLLDPKKNGFKLATKINQIPVNDDREVWTDSSCLLVNLDLYAELIERVASIRA